MHYKIFLESFQQFLKAYYQSCLQLILELLAAIMLQNSSKKEICTLDYEENYTAHLFWRRAAIYARLVELSKEEIKLLGWWKSNSYWLYIETYSD